MGNCMSLTPLTETVDQPSIEMTPPDREAPVLPAEYIAKMNEDRIQECKPIGWQNPDVLKWLDIIGLGSYRTYFLKNGVNGEYLLQIDPDDITNTLMIQNDMHKLSLLKAIDVLKAQPNIDYTNWRWSADNILTWLEIRGLSILKQSFKINAVHGGLLFGFTKEDFQNYLHIGTEFGSLLHLDSLMACIEYEKVKAKKNYSTRCSLGGSSLFSEDGQIQAISETEDPVDEEDKINIIPEWSLREVCAWLSDHYVGHLSDTFINYGVNGAYLLTLDRDVLEQGMNLTSVLSKSVAKKIDKLRTAYKEGISVELGIKIIDDDTSNSTSLRPSMAKYITEESPDIIYLDTPEEDKKLDVKKVSLSHVSL
ncbi:hypothetical protein WA158_007677 [Blastocystis sp. Blastoise]